MYRIPRSFAKPGDNNPYPDINKEKLPGKFTAYFLNKIEKIRKLFQRKRKYSPPIKSCIKLPDFKPLTAEQVLILIQHMNHTTCAHNQCNTKFLMKFKDTLIGPITQIIIISLSTGQYLDE